MGLRQIITSFAIVWATSTVVINAHAEKLGSEFRVNTTTVRDQEGSSVAGLRSGNFVVTWLSNQRYNLGVYGQRYTATGARIGGEFKINTAPFTMLVGRTSVAALQNGGFVVTWIADATPRRGIHGQRFDENGTRAGGEFSVAAGTSTPFVAGINGGGFVTTTLRKTPEGNVIVGNRFDEMGDKIGNQLLVSGPENLQNPIVTGLTGGGFVIIWSGYYTSIGVFGQMFDKTGAPVGSRFVIANTNSTPSVSALADDRFIVTWADGTNRNIVAQRYNSMSQIIGNQLTVAPLRGVTYPSAVGFMDGSFIIAWDKYDVFGQKFDASGTKMGGQFQISTKRKVTSPHLAALKGNDFVAIWDTTKSQDSSGFGVSGQRCRNRC